jgi:putative salt-induced outer membrane protein YdiY
MRFLLIMMLTYVSSLASCIGPTQDHSPSAPSPVPQPPLPQFAPVPPVQDGSDWIQLTTGEWLKGELLDIRDKTLEFDSEKLDELTFDMDDIAFVRSPRRQSVQLEGEEILYGTLLIKDGTVTVGGPGGGVAPRSKLMSAVPSDGSLLSHWKGKVTLGYTAREGNTRQLDLSTYIFARRQSATTRWDTVYNSAFSRSQSVETANNNRLASNFDVFLTKRLFLTPVAVTAYQDQFTNIDLRLTPSARLGYNIVDSNTLSWELGGGPAWEYTQYDLAPADQSIKNSAWAALANMNIDWDVTPDVEFTFGYEITIPVNNPDTYTHHLSTMLSLELTDSLDIDLQLIWDRVNKPLENIDGVTPRPDDLKISFGLGIEY